MPVRAMTRPSYDRHVQCGDAQPEPGGTAWESSAPPGEPYWARLRQPSRRGPRCPPADRLAQARRGELTQLIRTGLDWRLRWPQRCPCSPGMTCLLYTSDAADDLLCVDLGGRRIIKK